MTKTCTKILILLGVLALLVTGVSAVTPIYTIETGNLETDSEGNYYILNGTKLILPINITYESPSFISSVIINTTVENDGMWISNLNYAYKVNSTLKPMGTVTYNKPWQYQIASGLDPKGFNGTMADAITIDLTNLIYAEKPYNIAINIDAADHQTYLGDETKTLSSVKVYYLYQGSSATNENVWNMTIPLNATTYLLNGTDVREGDYTIPWKAETITRGASTLTINDKDTIAVWKKTNNEWSKTDDSKVTAIDTDKITIHIAGTDEKAQEYKLIFEGRRMGDLSDFYPNIGYINIADVDMVLQEIVNGDDVYIPLDLQIYADIDADSYINVIDASGIYDYIKVAVDRTAHPTVA